MPVDGVHQADALSPPLSCFGSVKDTKMDKSPYPSWPPLRVQCPYGAVFHSEEEFLCDFLIGKIQKYRRSILSAILNPDLPKKVLCWDPRSQT